jgi:hypothetical protein
MPSVFRQCSAILLALVCTTSCALRQARVPQPSLWAPVMALAPGTPLQIDVIASTRLTGDFVAAQQGVVLLRRGDETATVSRNRIARIWQVAPQRRDSILDGALWGIAIGAGVGIAFTAAAAESEGALTGADWARGVVIPAAVGAAIGVLVDSRKHSPARIEIYRK